MYFLMNMSSVRTEDADSDQVLFAMGCAASLIAARLSRKSLIDSSRWVAIHMAYLEHRKVELPERQIMVTKLSAVCSTSDRPTVFYHIASVGGDARGTLSWDGFNPIHTESIVEVLVRHFLSQQVAV